MRWTPSSRRAAALALVAVAALWGCQRDNEGAPSGQEAAGVRTHAVASGLPSGASVVISGYDLQGFWTRAQGTELYKSLNAIPGVRDAFAPMIEGRRKFETETGLALDQQTLMTVFGKKFDVGFYGPLEGDRADLLLVSQIGDETLAQKILTTLESKLVEAQNATFSDTEYSGRKIRVGKNRQDQEVLFYSLGDGALTMATTRARMQQALDLPDKGQSMSAAAGEYIDTLKKLPDATIAVYVNQKAIREAAQRAMADSTTVEGRAQRERFRAATSALEDYGLASAVAVGVYWTDNGVRADAYSLFPEGNRSKIASMLTRSPSAVRTLAFQPESTLLYTAANTFDAGIVYSELRRYAIDATRIQMGVKNTPDSLRADSLVDRQMREFQGQLGIDIEHDLVPWVGEELAFSINGVDQSGFFPVPEMAFTVATKDPQKTRAFMTEVEGALTSAARARASIPLQWQSEQYQGQTVRYAPTPMGEGLAVSYTVTNDFLLLATNRALAKRMLDVRAGRGPALPSNPDFKAMTKFYPQKANTLGFVNIERVLTQVEGLLTSYGQMRGAATADSTSTERRVLAALKNAPRLGFYSDADDDGVFGHFLLEVR